MHISEELIIEAHKIYLNKWVKTEYNSFQPDLYVFKNYMSIKDV